MLRLLTVYEDLETLRLRVEACIGRKVYIARAWDDQSRADFGRFLDWKQAPYIQFAVPHPMFPASYRRDYEASLERERAWFGKVHDAFRDVSLNEASGEIKIRLSDSDAVPAKLLPEEFKDFVREVKITPRGKKTKVIVFNHSGVMANPELGTKLTEWFAGKHTFTTPNSTATSVLAPGVHTAESKSWTGMEAWNRYFITDESPGRCVVCAGASDSRKHFGHIIFDPDQRFSGRVCASCAETTFEQWLKILKTV